MWQSFAVSTHPMLIEQGWINLEKWRVKIFRVPVFKIQLAGATVCVWEVEEPSLSATLKRHGGP